MKNVYVLAVIAFLTCSLVNAAFLSPNSIVGTPQLGVPYKITWEPIVSSSAITSNITKIRLQLGNGDGLQKVNVLFDFATLPFPDATSFEYTWPRNLTTTDANYTVVFQGLDASDKVVETEYITWFHLQPASARAVPTTTTRERPRATATVQYILPSPRKPVPRRETLADPNSYGVRNVNLSIGAFALALLTTFAVVTI